MRLINFLLIFFVLCLSFPTYGNNNAGGDMLERIININIKKQPLEFALDEIKAQGGFSFSYNPSILDLSKTVSFKGQNVTVRAVLTSILGYHYEFKQIGTHIIIREALTLTIKPIDQRKRKTRAELMRLKDNILLKGRVIDGETGIGLRYVVVYDETEKVITLTDSLGNYSLEVPLERMQKGVYFRNRGFYDTMVQFNPDKNQNEITYNVAMTPRNEDAHPVDADLALQSQNINQLKIVKRFVPKKVDIISNSIEYVEFRTGQITFIPFLSNTNFLGGSYKNRLSLNVLMGYSAGVENGVEIGSLANINRFDMKGFQVGGLTNIVGGYTTGFQVAGVVNHNMRRVYGFQAAGVTNIVVDSVMGMQVAGINNVVLENVKGFQVSGVVNTTKTAVKGLQVSSIYNYSKTVKGGQISGIYNTTPEDVKGLQLSGIGNYANEIVGAQISSIFNQVNGISKGVQIAALVNVANEQKGVQIGLFNYAKIGKKGVPIGLFNYYVDGYHSLEYYIDEFAYVNFAFRMGSRKLYTYYTLGTSYGIPNLLPEFDGVGYGFGFGTMPFKRMSIEVGFQSNNNFKEDVQDYHYFKSSIMYIQPIWKGISINLGPTFNYTAELFGEKENAEKITPPSFYYKETDRGPFWISGKIGITYTW